MKFIRYCSVLILPLLIQQSLAMGYDEGDVAYIDEVLEFNPGSGITSFADPSAATGPFDSFDRTNDRFVSLGEQGSITLKFTDNALIASGNARNDLAIYESGAEPEATKIEISHNGVQWIDLGVTDALFHTIDIDAFYSQGVQVGVPYFYVRLTDIVDGTEDNGNADPDGGQPFSGADIDAIGAISTVLCSEGVCPDLVTPEPFQYYVIHKATGFKLSTCGPDDGTEITVVNPEQNSDCEKWQKVSTGNYFYLKSVAADGYIRPRGVSNDVPIKVHPTSWTGNFMKWSLQDTGDGYGYLVNRRSQKYIFSDGETVTHASKQWKGDYTRWRLVPVQ